MQRLTNKVSRLQDGTIINELQRVRARNHPAPLAVWYSILFGTDENHCVPTCESILVPVHPPISSSLSLRTCPRTRTITVHRIGLRVIIIKYERGFNASQATSGLAP